jgi:hypothetical protein
MKHTRAPRVPGPRRTADDLALIVREWFETLRADTVPHDSPEAPGSPEQRARDAEQRERDAVERAYARLSAENLDERDRERVEAMITEQIHASLPTALLAQQLVAARRLGELLPEVYRCMELLSPWSFSFSHVSHVEPADHAEAADIYHHTASRPEADLSAIQSLRSFCERHGITVQPIDSSPETEGAWLRDQLVAPIVKSQLHRELRKRGIARTVTEASAIMGEGPDAQRQRERRLRQVKGASSSSRSPKRRSIPRKG